MKATIIIVVLLMGVLWFAATVNDGRKPHNRSACSKYRHAQGFTWQ